MLRRSLDCSGTVRGRIEPSMRRLTAPRLMLLVVPLVLLVGAVSAGLLVTQQKQEELAVFGSQSWIRNAETGVVELTGTTLAGGEFSTAEYRGTPVFVNVWASW